MEAAGLGRQEVVGLLVGTELFGGRGADLLEEDVACLDLSEAGFDEDLA